MIDMTLPFFSEQLLAEHDYALVDIGMLYADYWHAELPLERLVPELLANEAHLMPGLLSLKALNEEQNRRFINNLREAAQGRETCLISSLFNAPDANAEELKTHLTNRLVLRSPQGKAYFRYFDSRAFIHFERILSPEQIAVLYGPITLWTVSFLLDEWLQIKAPKGKNTSSENTSDKNTSENLSVSAEQREQLNRVSFVNEALNEFKFKTGHSWSSVADYHVQAAQVDRAVAIAMRDYHLTSPNDITNFGIHALLYGEHFHLSPRIQALFQEVETDRYLSYSSAATHNVSDEEWAAVAAWEKLHNTNNTQRNP
jgi:hypothetical protein